MDDLLDSRDLNLSSVMTFMISIVQWWAILMAVYLDLCCRFTDDLELAFSPYSSKKDDMCSVV